MTFLVNNQTWKIEEIPADNSKLLVNGTFRQGATHYDTQTLYLLDSLKPDRKREVLRHELAHCFLYATQSYYEKDSFSEEEICELFGLYAGQIVDIANEYFCTKGEK